jgi:hypothetical protein
VLSVSSVVNPLPPKNNRRKLSPPPAFYCSLLLSDRLTYVRRLGPFRPLYDFEFDRISFLQRPVTIPDYRGIMNEHIGPIFSANESVSFRIIKPLYCS